MDYYGTEIRLATNADIPRLPKMLDDEARCHLVRVRNLWFVDESQLGFDLLAVVKGPFHVTEEDGLFVIHGFDRVTGQSGKARVRGEVLEYCTRHYQEWGESPEWIRLYVPEG